MHFEENQFITLKEADVGITEYLNDCKGFSAVLKQRFSDFHVHEIDLDGNIVRLTKTEIPEIKSENVDFKAISDEYWEKLDNLHNHELETVEIDVTDLSKERRKLIHKAVKFKYGSLFKSSTIDVGNKKIIMISREQVSNRSSLWFTELGNYLHFVLFKKNLDTATAINIIASYLKTKSSNLTYAGTKDKRANTTQWVSMWHLDAVKLNEINKSLKGLKVGNYIYKNHPLKLGDLKGNYFEIVLRSVNEADEFLIESLKSVKDNGFINYFGLQRFGNCFEIPTYIIGKALVKGDFKSAVELILKPRKGKMENDLRKARETWWESRDAARAIKCLKSKNQTIEGQLLKGLAKHGKNAYVNALDFIPRNIRLLYLHAYQSFIWNKILSKRINEFGKSVLEGDLVLVDNETEVQDTSKKKSDEALSLKNKVRYLNNEELQSFKLTDIVHPLPGYKIDYPNNIIKKWYDDCLKEDELTVEDLKQTVRQYSLSGTYRHIVKKVNDMSWEIHQYSDPETDLILSDLDKLNGKTLQISQNNDKNYKAVLLKLTLDSSTYATMVLREILKADTSSSYQATLNGNFNKRRSEDNNQEPIKKRKSSSENI